jgi:pimeloyl-ACP methyl ester carboxylesterase
MHGPAHPDRRDCRRADGLLRLPQGDEPPSPIYTNLQRWTEMPKGGHFAAIEQPEALAGEIQSSFRSLR